MSFGTYLPRKWTRQPDYPVELDYGCDALAGITVCCAFVGGDFARSAVVGNTTTYSMGLRIDTAEGMAWGNTTSSDRLIVDFQSISVAERSQSLCTIVRLASARSADQSGTVIARADLNWSNATVGWSTTEGGRFYTSHSVSGGAVVTGYGQPRTSPRFRECVTVAGLYKSGVQQSLIEDGVVTTTLITETGSRVSASSFESLGSSTSRWGILAGAVLKGQDINTDQLAELTKNIYQMFRRQRVPVFYSLPSSGIPILSFPGVTEIGKNSARPRVTLTY